MSDLNYDLNMSLRPLAPWITPPNRIHPWKPLALTRYRALSLDSFAAWDADVASCRASLSPSSFSGTFTLSHPPSIPPGIRSDWRQGSDVARRRGECDSRPQCERELWKRWANLGKSAPCWSGLGIDTWLAMGQLSFTSHLSFSIKKEKRVCVEWNRNIQSSNCQIW